MAAMGMTAGKNASKIDVSDEDIEKVNKAAKVASVASIAAKNPAITAGILTLPIAVKGAKALAEKRNPNGAIPETEDKDPESKPKESEGKLDPKSEEKPEDTGIEGKTNLDWLHKQRAEEWEPLSPSEKVLENDKTKARKRRDEAEQERKKREAEGRVGKLDPDAEAKGLAKKQAKEGQKRWGQESEVPAEALPKGKTDARKKADEKEAEVAHSSPYSGSDLDSTSQAIYDSLNKSIKDPKDLDKIRRTLRRLAAGTAGVTSFTDLLSDELDTSKLSEEDQESLELLKYIYSLLGSDKPEDVELGRQMMDDYIKEHNLLSTEEPKEEPKEKKESITDKAWFKDQASQRR